MEANKKTICIGNEYDDEIFKKLGLILKQEGAVLGNKLNALSGSQDYVSYELLVHGKEITIEIETYMGISITGSEKTVNELLKKLGVECE